MENSNGITPVMPIGDGGFGDGLGGGLWVFALLILLMLGGNGGGLFGNNNALQNDVNRGFDNQNLQAQTRDILAAVNSGTAQSVAATNQTFHDNLAAMQSLYNETARDIAGLAVGQANQLANQNECCCSTKMLIAETGAGINAGIAQNRYDAALNTAAINANTTAQTQRILDALSQDKVEALQAKVSALELQNQLASVVRYPSNTFYAVPSPCFNTCGCGCGSI
jgi:hypothetical protein